jgi:hypothetical protein
MVWNRHFSWRKRGCLPGLIGAAQQIDLRAWERVGTIELGEANKRSWKS